MNTNDQASSSDDDRDREILEQPGTGTRLHPYRYSTLYRVMAGILSIPLTLVALYMAVVSPMLVMVFDAPDSGKRPAPYLFIGCYLALLAIVGYGAVVLGKMAITGRAIGGSQQDEIQRPLNPPASPQQNSTTELTQSGGQVV